MKKEINMRELSIQEIEVVNGGTWQEDLAQAAGDIARAAADAAQAFAEAAARMYGQYAAQEAARNALYYCQNVKFGSNGSFEATGCKR